MRRPLNPGFASIVPLGFALLGCLPAATLAGGWTRLQQPCSGTRTSAFWWDDARRGYVGCGQNADGTGLYVTADGGQTWTPQDAFAGARINDIRRGPDGRLYAAGDDKASGFQVFTIDVSGDRYELDGLYRRSRNALISVAQGETIAVTADGQLFVDNLTGSQTAWRPAGATDFQELSTFLDTGLGDSSASSEQVSRVIAFGNRFWAVGSVINRPATVYVPSGAAGATDHMTGLPLQDADLDGELYDIHVWSETSAIVAGRDQSNGVPLIFRLEGKAGERSNWKRIELRDSGIELQGVAWKLAVAGDDVVLVGQTFPGNDGFVVRSADRGRTWTDLSPRDAQGHLSASLLTNVWLFDDGSIRAAGAGGELWVYGP